MVCTTNNQFLEEKMKKVIRLAVLMLVFLMAASIVFAGGNRQSGGKSNRVGISMPTQSTERWVLEGNLIKTELEKLGY